MLAEHQADQTENVPIKTDYPDDRKTKVIKTKTTCKDGTPSHKMLYQTYHNSTTFPTDEDVRVKQWFCPVCGQTAYTNNYEDGQ